MCFVGERDLKRAKRNRNSNLHSGKWNATTWDSSYNVNDKSGNIDCELKLDEFLNVGVDWSSPANNLYTSDAIPCLVGISNNQIQLREKLSRFWQWSEFEQTLTTEAKLSSKMMMSELSLATSVPAIPIARPISAWKSNLNIQHQSENDRLWISIDKKKYLANRAFNSCRLRRNQF